jgi:PAS domain S-box-containing protein
MPLLARLKVGTKLMLLVLLPVCVLLGFTSVAAVADWRFTDTLRSFQAATRLSFATATLADRIAAERTAAVLLFLPAGQPGPRAAAGLAAAQREVNQALRQAERDAAGRDGTGDVAGRLGAVRRQLAAVRTGVAAGSLPVQQVPGSYGVIVNGLMNATGDLVAGRPTQASGRAADAYLAILQAVEAAERERADVAEALGTPGHYQLTMASSWAALEGAGLDAFRRSADQRLAAGLGGVLSAPSGRTVQRVRHDLLSDPGRAVAHTSLATWLDASGARIDGLRSLESGAARDLAASASMDISAAEADITRDLIISLAVLVVVTALALALRRSITRPLREVSHGARTLSGGDLTSDVSYAGRDEIGDVAAAFRDLHVTAERLAGEIRATNAAISGSRLDHRADVGAFEGTWAQLLAGMNDTTAAFARLHRRRRRAEHELEGIFNLSLDLLCVAGQDGYFKRVNPAFERALGYSSKELLARPYVEFIHPDDRALSREVQQSLARGDEVTRFENRYVRRDGAERWLQWSARLMPEEGLIYAAARDVTDSRRARQELAASRARIVAASDETRRRIERDLHDGAQQRLVSLGLGLRAARESVPPDQAGLRGELARVADGIAGVLEELRELSRGIHPAVLSVGGLGPALKTLARRSAVPVRLDIGPQDRLPERVEVAAYFVVSEALANAAKHARASVVQVRTEVADGLLKVRICDDGIGGADPSRGSGLLGLTDRVEALGGTIAVRSPAGAGTDILAQLPVGDGRP